MQPEVNIGLVGHVDHGKTTLTQQLSGKWTDTHSEELKRGITIRLGYADAVIRKISGMKGAEQYTVQETVGNKKTEPVRTISLIDAPGHESLMATMLAGASLMDGALLLIAANEHCPQPQTIEHVMALEMSGIENVIIVQNKIDLVSAERAKQNYEQLKEFLKDTKYAHAPVIPLSAQHGVNMDALLEAIEKHIPTPKRDLKADPLFSVARSFDINKPGTNPTKLKGGVLGGSVYAGQFTKGGEIEIRPGRVVEEANKKVAKPIRTKVSSLMAGGDSVSTLTPGGSSALLTGLDPNIVKSDSLTGSLVGTPGKLPPIWYTLTITVTLLDRAVGLHGAKEVEPLKAKELLMLNIHSAATVGVVTALGKDEITVSLRKPICAAAGERLTISRRQGTRFHLVGYGQIKAGERQE